MKALRTVPGSLFIMFGALFAEAMFFLKIPCFCPRTFDSIIKTKIDNCPVQA